MAISETNLVNMAFAKIGAKRINDITADTSVEAIHARIQYEQTRDALLRSFTWPFATKRVALSLDTETPAFDYDYQFILPSDYLRLVSTDIDTTETDYLKIEGKRILVNESTLSIRYVRRVTDPTEFDPLFIEILVLHLALKFINPLAGTNMVNVIISIQQELNLLTARARAISKQEQSTSGSSEWNNARFGY